MKRLCLWSFIFSTICSVAACAQTKPSPSTLDQVIADEVSQNSPVSNAGIAIAVITNTMPVYANGFGLANRATSGKVDPSTLFAIGSNTKAFTSFVASLLAEENRLQLDSPVRNWLADFAMRDKDAGNKMTLVDLLSHQTGIPRHDALWYLGPFTRAQLYYRVRYLHANPNGGFRRSFDYNNMMYGVAGTLLEVATGKSWDSLIKTRIFAPLSMGDSVLSTAEFAAKPNRALGYEQTRELALDDVTNIAPAAAVHSNLPDLTKWLLLWLNRGVAPGGKRLISEESLANMYKPQLSVAGGSYGLGWFTCQVGGSRLVYHPGNAQGYSAHISFMPDKGHAVIALSNQNFSNFPVIVASRIYDYLLTGTAKQTAIAAEMMSTVQCPLLADRPKPSQCGSSVGPISSEYFGIYSNPAFGDITVSPLGGQVSISYYQRSWQLIKTSADMLCFEVDGFGITRAAPVMFDRNDDGLIVKLSIPFDPIAYQIQFRRRTE